MASARIVLGGEIDVTTKEEMDAGFADLKSALKGNGVKAKKILRPITQAVSFGALVSGNTVVVSSGRPSMGRTWVVTRVTVLGVDDHTATANLSAALYIGDPANASLGQCVAPGAAVPFVTLQNEHAYYVHDSEEFFVLFTATGAVTAGSCVVNIAAWEYLDTQIEQQVI